MRSRDFRVMPCLVLMFELFSVSCRVFVLDQHCVPFRVLEIVICSVLFRVFFYVLFGFPCRLVFGLSFLISLAFLVWSQRTNVMLHGGIPDIRSGLALPDKLMLFPVHAKAILMVVVPNCFAFGFEVSIAWEQNQSQPFVFVLVITYCNPPSWWAWCLLRTWSLSSANRPSWATTHKCKLQNPRQPVSMIPTTQHK